jgi:MFS family permease
VVQSFAQYYIRDVLRVPDAAGTTGNLMAVIGVALTVLVFPAGMLSDRFGRRPLNVFSGVLAALGIFLVAFARTVPALLVFGGTIGMATGIFVSVNWALATDLIPQEEAGKYLGLSNLATAGSAALARLVGPLIDGLNSLWPGRLPGVPPGLHRRRRRHAGRRVVDAAQRVKEQIYARPPGTLLPPPRRAR